MGRLSTYSQDIADAICARLAEGESLRSICEAEDMPGESTVRSWVNDNQSGFAAQYARAREIGYDRLAEEVMHIADTPMLGQIRTVKPDGSEEIKFADMIEHRRLQVDTRKWLLARVLPKKYGDKLDLNHGGNLAVTWPVKPPAIEGA